MKEFLLIMLVIPLGSVTKLPLATPFQIETLPNIHVNQLTIADFESSYLDRKPIIIDGTTTCPSKLKFESISEYCGGEIPGNYVNRKNERENKWAGLEEGNKKITVDFNQWVKNMGVKEQPEFMFDVPMVEICPTLMSDVMVPGHFVGTFASQYQHRRQQSSTSRSPDGEQMQLRGKANMKRDDEKKNYIELDTVDDVCVDLPFYNIYLAEDSFQTDLHIDAGHSTFITSMCAGRKRWRVMTNDDYSKVHSTIGIGGHLVNDTLVLGTIHSPFNTWNDHADDFILKYLDVTVYEGILEPGQVLYIPAGAPHAATTLEKSLMVASNDHSLKNLRDAVAYCDFVQNNHASCHDFRLKLKSMKRSLSLMENFERVETSLPVSTGCEKTYDLLGTLSQDRFLMITPENFRSLIQDGPLVILMSQKNCGSCLFLLNSWERIVRGFDPPVRFGVLHCFQGQCPFGEDELYSQVFNKFREKNSPDFQFVRMRGEHSLSFSDYCGFLSFDDLRVWVSVHSGSKIDIGPWWWKHSLEIYHLSAYFFTTIFSTVGTVGIFIFIFALFTANIVVWDFISNLLKEKIFGKEGKSKKS